MLLILTSLLLYIFELIKAVSDTVLDMMNAVYHDKPLIFIGATFQKKLVYHHRTVNVLVSKQTEQI